MLQSFWQHEPKPPPLAGDLLQTQPPLPHGLGCKKTSPRRSYADRAAFFLKAVRSKCGRRAARTLADKRRYQRRAYPRRPRCLRQTSRGRNAVIPDCGLYVRKVYAGRGSPRLIARCESWRPQGLCAGRFFSRAGATWDPSSGSVAATSAAAARSDDRGTICLVLRKSAFTRRCHIASSLGVLRTPYNPQRS